MYQKGHRNFCIYEQDEGKEARQQGYGLTILQGFTALKKLSNIYIYTSISDHYIILNICCIIIIIILLVN